MSDWKNVQYKDGKMRTSEGGGGGGSSTFAGLDDVSFSNLQDGQVPKYNSTTQKWENANESGGGGTVTDVTVDGTSVVNPQGVAEIETPDADGIEYDNQQSGLSATDVQSAIDELAQGSGGGGVEDVEVNGTSVVNAQNVAEIKSYKEVTLAEYQALPSTKESDGIMYCIKDVGGANQFPPLIYSDEEREIGVWRDGKPLYIKTFDCGAMPNAGHKYIPHNINDLDFIAQAYGVSHSAINNYYFPLPFTNTGGIAASVQLHITSTDIVLVTGTSDRRNWNRTYVTLLYTKTTDTAGSGTWTTQGGYAHHYSTTEQVIGTWIDGKPLYEKTIRINSGITSGQNVEYNHNIQNVDTIFIQESFFTLNSSGTIRYRRDNWQLSSVSTSSASVNGEWCVSAVDASDTKVRITIGSQVKSTVTEIAIVVRYTKTTD